MYKKFLYSSQHGARHHPAMELGQSLDASSEQRLLFEAMRKKTHMMCVMSECVCKYNGARYVMAMADEVGDKLVDWQGRSSAMSLIQQQC
jgi:hypothetical protein